MVIKSTLNFSSPTQSTGMTTEEKKKEFTEAAISDLQIMEGGVGGEYNYKITFNSSTKIPMEAMGNVIKECIEFLNNSK